jgi:hypothetical protein
MGQFLRKTPVTQIDSKRNRMMAFKELKVVVKCMPSSEDIHEKGY